MKREGGDFHAINIPGGFADHPEGKPLRVGKSRAGSQIFCFWKLLLRPSALALSDLFPRMRGGFQHVKAPGPVFFLPPPIISFTSPLLSNFPHKEAVKSNYLSKRFCHFPCFCTITPFTPYSSCDSSPSIVPG
jgi:hypothetical protein